MSGFWVSYRSVVHREDGNCPGARYPWDPRSRFDFDRPCLNCMPGGLPNE